MSRQIKVDQLATRLSDLLLQLRGSDSHLRVPWHEVALVAQDIANELRTKDEYFDIHTELGKTKLPHNLTALLRLSMQGGSIPDDQFTTATLELLRVGANMCMDHNGNRGALLDAGFPQAVVSILEGYIELASFPIQSEPLPLALPHLKVIRTAVGVLLNASVGYEPVKSRLLSVEAVLTILKLSSSIYPTGSWQYHSIIDEPSQASIDESWALRSGLSNWVWRTTNELRDVTDESLQKISPEVLSVLTPTLAAFTPSGKARKPIDVIAPDSDLYHALVRADFDALEETCSLIESLSLDVEDIRYSLARGFRDPKEHNGVPCLQTILAFIEEGGYPASWNLCTTLTEAEVQQMQKAFGIFKAALVKSVVEVAGEETNENILWYQADGGEFVAKMVKWIKDFVASVETAPVEALLRDDLVICASLSLGNLARRDKHAKVLLSPPHAIAPVLMSPYLIGPDVDIKLKHGVIGLLKHMAQSSPTPDIHNLLLEADVVRHISQSGVWDQKADNMAEVVQLSAIGVVKHMCGAKVENAFKLVLPQDGTPTTGLEQILALVRRSESVSIKSEGSRVLVNVIKTLFSNDIPTSPPSPATPGAQDLIQKQRKRQAAIRLILTQENVNLLALLVARSGKYPILVNEGVVALSLISTQRVGAPLVAKALQTSATEGGSEPETTSSSALSSPSVTTPSSSSRIQLPTPETATDMIVGVLRNVDNPANFQVEVRINVCSLLLQLGKQGSVEQLRKVKNRIQPVLEQLVEDLQDAKLEGKDAILLGAAKEVMKTWGIALF